jgi:hypothetical protein
MKYYKKFDIIPSLPNELTDELVIIAENNVANNIPFATWYGESGSNDKNTIAYSEKEEERSFLKKSGGVGFYHSPIYLSNEIVNFYKENSLVNMNVYYLIQVVTGGNFVAPHIDDPSQRHTGLYYLIKAGGPNVRTKWYQVKDEYQHLEIENYKGIPYSKVIEVEDRCLEENTWHWMNFSEIHSVENQETLRVGLWGVQSLIFNSNQ